MSFQISNKKQLKNQWLVQKLADDFIVEDAWELPIQFYESENDTLFTFRKNVIQPMITNLFNSTFSGVLFHIRGIIGHLTGIDKNVNTLPIPGCKEISLAERMSENEKMIHNPDLDIDIAMNNYLNFRPVYSFRNETLHELSNSTEHSLMHYAWVKDSENIYTVHLTVYVKHRNRLGIIYMKLIKPFRHWIVYPYIMKECVRLWNQFNADKLK